MIVPTVAANPVILMLKNAMTNKYHPTFYWECPPPSGQLGDGLRWKSKGHHTTGFASRENAVASAMALVEANHAKLEVGSVYYELGQENDIEWSGGNVPADVTVFDLTELTKYEPEAD
ncbi:MAG: hypothetical protein GY833_21755 [Aestuariibacter sp.]|nr:hypothetical protein [Aestuariibacter sp.]|tara:strand:+ start:106585 stop:106938 length:354 start_codon:yes stop_codon:yes gene_type:complete